MDELKKEMEALTRRVAQLHDKIEQLARGLDDGLRSAKLRRTHRPDAKFHAGEKK